MCTSMNFLLGISNWAKHFLKITVFILQSNLFLVSILVLETNARRYIVGQGKYVVL